MVFKNRKIQSINNAQKSCCYSKNRQKKNSYSRFFKKECQKKNATCNIGRWYNVEPKPIEKRAKKRGNRNGLKCTKIGKQKDSPQTKKQSQNKQYAE